MYTVSRSAASAAVASSRSHNTPNVLVMGIVAATLLLASLVFDVSELAVAVVGACLYYLVNKMNQQTHVSKPKGKAKVEPELPTRDEACKVKPRFDIPRTKLTLQSTTDKALRRPTRDGLTSTVKPIDAPVFLSTGFEAEVRELLTQISPSAETDIVVSRLVDVVKKAILPRVPGAEIVGFASGNALRSKAFGVALPEIDIVINASPVVLARCLEARLTKGGAAAVRSDPHKLQKAALRACTDELVSVSELKFRRSGFKGEYPKVTLLAPVEVTRVNSSVGMDLSVNAVTPLHSAMLLTECGHLEPRAKELIMLVRRWTRDRGIAHAAKGHLSHYGWTLLTIYFLQVWESSDGFLLPSLECFERSGSLLQKRNEDRSRRTLRASECNMSVAALFKELVRFYNQHFDWRNEAISVRLGQRAAPSLALPLHIVEGPEVAPGTPAPSVEDPFDVRRNVAMCMTACGMLRMREELTRAEDLLESSASLATLLTLWVPPEAADQAL